MPRMTRSHNSCKTCNIAKSNLYSNLHVMLVTVCGSEQNPSRGVGGVAHTRFSPFMLYSKKMTKTHNSCKTCSIAKLGTQDFGTYVRKDRQTYVWRSANLCGGIITKPNYIKNRWMRPKICDRNTCRWLIFITICLNSEASVYNVILLTVSFLAVDAYKNFPFLSNDTTFLRISLDVLPPSVDLANV